MALFVSPFAQYTDASGNPGSGYLLYFYTTGTTTPITIYSDAAFGTSTANPAVADSAGQWDAIYVNTATYKVVMKTAAGVTIRTADPVPGNLASGPTSATDNAVARFNGTTGKILQGSGVIIDDSNNVTGIAGLTATTVTADTATIETLAHAGRPMTQQILTASATWTKTSGCVRAIFEACGGGGGSGGVDGTGVGFAGATGGGGSGFYAMTGVLNVSAVTSAAVVIGAAGAAGAIGANDGGNGGDTTITISGVAYLWGGGNGSPGYTASASVSGAGPCGQGGASSNLVGYAGNGSMGSSQADAGAGRATGGNGGSSGFGRGGQGAHTIAAEVIAGEAGQGKGAGAGGSVVNETNSNVPGAAGTIGYMRIWEFY